MENKGNLCFVVLAAGMGKRLGGENQKTVTKLLGKPMLKYLLETIKKINPSKIIIVIGFKKEEVFKELEGENVEYVEQKELKGTGDAVLQAEKILNNFKGDIIVLNGDVPFISEKTINTLIKIHREENSYCTFLTSIVDNPTGYGRILRNERREVIGIVEEVNASDEEKRIKEINAGVYVFKSDSLFSSLKKIEMNSLKKEYYLTDIIKIYRLENKKISTYTTPDPDETIGINTLSDLKKAEEYLKKRRK
ncbi:MAG TPA: sugar phosphate nucleotidyltransferase [bacterium]|nr:sugar phosphate nucleotidyltransferase [bacterium]HOM25904.1 sugar phosphate nucleotidyltransferase [bacterium]